MGANQQPTDTPLRADSRHLVWVHETPCCGRQVFAASAPSRYGPFSPAKRLSDPDKGEVRELMVERGRDGHADAIWHQTTPSGTHALSAAPL